MKQALKHEIFEVIRQTVRQEEVEAYVIGGFVRDFLLKRKSKDIDIVVIGDGIGLARKVVKALGGKSKLSIFKNFGTAYFTYRDAEIEFVGARKESYRKNSRKPVVAAGTLEDDQNRRDFTINALAIGLHNNHYGELLDPFKGTDDLKNKIIRTPLDPLITFSDDPLRMLRAIRFASQLNFTIDEHTFSAISTNKERIKIVSKERIADELNKIVLSDKPSIGFKLMESSGLLEIIIPELYNLKGIENLNGKAHKDNFMHSIKVLDNISKKTDNLWLRWTALLHDIGKAPTKKYDKDQGWTFHGHEYLGSKMLPGVFRNLKMPLDKRMKYVQKLIRLHLRPIVLSLDTITDSALRRLLFEVGDDLEDLMTLCEADITSRNDQKVKQYLRNFKIVRKKLKEIEEKDAIRNFQPPISGDIICKTFNIEPGREIGIIKNAVKDAILDGVIRNDYQEAYNFMIQKASELGLKPVHSKNLISEEDRDKPEDDR